MHVNEFVARQIGHNKRLGYWKVKQKCFFDKTECLEYSSSINDSDITYHYLDEVYKKLDWSKEPIESLDKLYSLLSLQIKTSNVKLPLVDAKSHKIQDNNQAISNGAINEKSNSSLRSKSPTRTVRRRSTKS
jgi:hypothetical protein